MKLFDDFEAVKFPEENLIFVIRKGFLYYIYNPKHNHWIKYFDAGNVRLTVSNYPDVSSEELVAAMNGVFPTKETDFIRLCPPSHLRVRDMLSLLQEDYANYMSDYSVYHTVHRFLLESDTCYKSFEAVLKLLDNAAAHQHDNSSVVAQIKDLSFAIIGRDIFKREIGIVDGHNGSAYFWIMPVRVIDYSDTNELDNVAQMRSAEISIEEDAVAQYLTPFLYKHFDDDLDANKRRIEDRWIDNDGNEQTEAVCGFEWYLTHNFFTFDSMMAIMKDIGDTMDALSSGRENEFTTKLKEKSGTSAYEFAKEIDEHTEIELILDFYRRFIYRMEYMLTVGKEKGYNLISFMGP